MKTQSIFIFTNGCGRRQLDAEKLKNYFKINDFRIAKNPRDAECIIFISCAFIKNREDESFKIIKNFKKFKKKLIVAGCLPEISKNKLSQIFKGKTLSVKNLNEIDNIFKDFKFKFSSIPDANLISSSTSPLLPILSAKKNLKEVFVKDSLNLIKGRFINNLKNKLNPLSTSHYIRISHGCLGNCSYCSIRRAIGTLKSKPIEICKEEYKKILKSGSKHIVIFADDVGAYGLDINSSFPRLLNEFLKIDIKNISYWQIKELNARWIIKYEKELLEIIRKNKIKHMLCGIQSGSDRILGLMNRQNNSGELIAALKKFKKADPNLKISAQIIIGFPSENESDFMATLNLIKQTKFNEVILYPYSDREGTVAFQINPKIPDNIKKERIKTAINFLRKEKINYCL